MDLNALYTSKAEYVLQRLNGRHYEHGEKAGHLLAEQLRKREAALAIPAIQSLASVILTRPQDTVGEFSDFYWTLYTKRQWKILIDSPHSC
ncbi:hypothetical protein NDU88_002607 [Pleurodeles waltl]|uniref:Uncharacterized protein n=1 Tax=Pleurodeles waltl TaxID=8319 RepID=A0AAV7MRY3_PLEWA|nr:hypothetical protein NDU88_002607 [Pleurodeles waltl]